MDISVKISHAKLQNFIFWLLVTAGPVKPVFEYFNSPFDWTFIVFLLAVLEILLTAIYFPNRVRLNREKMLILFLFLCFTSFMLFTLVYTPSKGYAIEKTLLFGVNILMFIYPLFMSRFDALFQYRLYILLIVPVVIWFIVYKHLYYSPQNIEYQIIRIDFYEIRNKYLGLGMVVVFYTLIQVYLRKPALFLFLPAVLLLGLGTRGSLLFLTITLVLWKWKAILGILYSGTRLKKKFATVLLPVIILLISIVSFNLEKIAGVLYLGLYRFESLLSFGSDVSSQGRITRIVFALESVFSSATGFLFGHGLGSFGILYSGQDIRDYPHNLILEIWFEMGLFGVLILILMIGTPFYFKRPLLYKTLVFCFLLHAMKSGDLVGLWIFFLSFGLLVFNPRLIHG